MSNVTEKIQDLLNEIGPFMADIDAVIQTDDPSWAIQFNDEAVILIEQLDQPDRIVFSSDIGSVADDVELPVYEALLCYNLLWRETGGIKIGLAGPKGSLIITSELLLENLTLLNFQEAILNFLSVCRSWRKYVLIDSKSSLSLPNISSGNFHLQA